MTDARVGPLVLTLPLLFGLVLIASAGCGGGGSGGSAPAPAAQGWTAAVAIDGAPAPTPDCNPTFAPRVGMDGQGNGIATWLQNCQVWAARYSPGQGWLLPQAIGGLPPGAAPNFLWEPSMAVNGEGDAVVTWEAEVFPQVEIWATVFAPPSGWSQPVRIDGGLGALLTENYAPGVAIDPSGSAFVVWASGGIVAVRYTGADGWDPPERISGPKGAAVPAVFVDGLGRAFALWSDSSGNAVARRFEPDSGWEAPTEFSPEDPWFFTYSGQSLAFDAEGRALLFWNRARIYFPSYVWAARFDGMSWTELGEVSSPGVDAGPAEAGFGSDGRGLAVWGETTSFAVASIDASGGVGQETHPLPGAGPWTFVLNGAGNGFLAWSEFEAQQALPGGAVEGIQRIKGASVSGGAWSVPAEIQKTTNGATSNPPGLAVDSCGNALAVWSEYDGIQNRVWAARYDAGCSLAP